MIAEKEGRHEDAKYHSDEAEHHTAEALAKAEAKTEDAQDEHDEQEDEDEEDEAETEHAEDEHDEHESPELKKIFGSTFSSHKNEYDEQEAEAEAEAEAK